MQCPAPRGITLCTSGGWEQPGGKQLCKEGSVCPGGQQGDLESAAPHGSRGDEPHPGLPEQEHSQPSFAPAVHGWSAYQACCIFAQPSRRYSVRGNLLSPGALAARVVILLSSSHGLRRRGSCAAGCDPRGYEERELCNRLHSLSLQIPFARAKFGHRALK